MNWIATLLPLLLMNSGVNVWTAEDRNFAFGDDDAGIEIVPDGRVPTGIQFVTPWWLANQTQPGAPDAVKTKPLHPRNVFLQPAQGSDRFQLRYDGPAAAEGWRMFDDDGLAFAQVGASDLTYQAHWPLVTTHEAFVGPAVNTDGAWPAGVGYYEEQAKGATPLNALSNCSGEPALSPAPNRLVNYLEYPLGTLIKIDSPDSKQANDRVDFAAHKGIQNGAVIRVDDGGAVWIRPPSIGNHQILWNFVCTMQIVVTPGGEPGTIEATPVRDGADWGIALSGDSAIVDGFLWRGEGSESGELHWAGRLEMDANARISLKGLPEGNHTLELFATWPGGGPMQQLSLSAHVEQSSLPMTGPGNVEQAPFGLVPVAAAVVVAALLRRRS